MLAQLSTWYQTAIQTPYLAASAANASGFLLVSLSKMPRIKISSLRPGLLHVGISDQG
jgi:hypothetical protein